MIDIDEECLFYTFLPALYLKTPWIKEVLLDRAKQIFVCDCGCLVQGHERCEACGIFACGKEYYMPIVKYRGRYLCRGCYKQWITRNKKENIEITWEQLTGDGSDYSHFYAIKSAQYDTEIKDVAGNGD